MSSTEIQAKSLNRSLELCKRVTQDIINHLTELKKEINRHHVKVLAAKTSGTTATTLGTGLAVTGLILAPFTLGTSLIISSVGALTTVGGAATNMVTDMVDRSKKNKFIENIRNLAEEQKNAKRELMLVLEIFTEVIESLMAKGLSEKQAIYGALHGDRCKNNEEYDNLQHSTDDDDFEWVDNPDGKWKPIRKFCFKAGMDSITLIKDSKNITSLALGGKDLATASASAVASTSVAAHVGRFLGSTVFRGTMAVAGVVFSTIDVVLLLEEWKNKNPTASTIQTVIDEFTEEINQYEQLIEKIEMLEKCEIFVGWIDKTLPVVGTNPFAVEAVLSIFDFDFERVKLLYGDIVPESLSDDFKLAVLNIVYSQNLAIGPLLYDRIEKFVSLKVSQVKDKSSDEDNEDDQPEKPSVPFAEPVKNLNEVFNQSVLQDDTISIPVFNLDILNFYKEIIDSFLAQGSYPYFEDLRPYLKGTSVIDDYDNPLPSSTVDMLRKVLVAYYKYDGYLNANKWEYESTVNLMKKYAGLCFMEEYDLMTSAYATEDNDDNNNEKSPNMDLLNELVEVLINHKSYIDPVAGLIWRQSESEGDKANIYNSVLDLVSKIFLHLKFKIPIWACDLHSVIKTAQSSFFLKES